MKLPFWPDQKGYRDIELGLSRVYDLLARLGNPHEKIPPTIHIAGTNGKGSTLAFLKAIFEEGNYSVHTYTSPHLVEFNERIVLCGQNISDEFLNECLQSCKDAAETHPKIDVTYFEGITVAAFLAFSKVKADILLLETGLGGRLDATNVIKKNLLSIITPISFDHTEFLGDNLAKIAFEKAGIIKAGCPVIIGKQEPEVFETINKRATELESKIYQNQKYNIPQPSLLGLHQIENACLAITAALAQKKFPITFEQASHAITKAKWSARLQKITAGKYFNLLPTSCELYVDGSHNLQGATTVFEFLKSQKTKNIVIFGMLKDKDCEGFLRKIKDKIDLLIAIKIPDEPKARQAEEILEIAKKLRINAIVAKNFDDAFSILSFPRSRESSCRLSIVYDWILTFAEWRRMTRLLICGSLYLAGSFLEKNN